MKSVISVFVVVVLGFLFNACNEGTQDPKAHLVGVRSPVNQIIVIASDKTWEAGFKSFIMDSLITPRKGMFFAEPEFSIRRFPTLKRAKSYDKYPNYIVLSKGTEGLKLEQDVFAKGQTIATVTGENLESIEKTLSRNKDKIFKQFHLNDERAWRVEHMGKYYDSYPELDKMGIFFRIPLTFMKVNRQRDFVHYQYDSSNKTRNRSANLTVITKPYTLDTIALENIIGLRDLTGRKHIRSTEEGTYMETDSLLSDYISSEVIKDTPEVKIYKTEGMWSMKNDVKGGAFVNYVLLDKKQDKLFMFDGFTFVSSSGNTNTATIFYRRDLLTELEFIFNSYKILK